jgi:glycine dehydrogenase
MASESFQHRHIGTDSAAQQHMLTLLGYDSLTDLVHAAIPENIQIEHFREVTDSLLPEPVTEAEALAELRELAERNTVRRSMIGLGYYNTFTPAVIKRNVLENPSWYTAYTPYQPEISQGRLEALINFQTMVSDFTGLPIANASMLDEGTAVVEAMLLARRASKVDSRVFLVDTDVLPQTMALLQHRAVPVDIELVEIDFAAAAAAGSFADLPEAFGAVVQYPGASGRVWDSSALLAALRASGAISVVAADLLALALMTSPGELGADVAVGTTQRFGVPLGFGGPHAGYMAVSAGLERSMPGRLVGVSVDADGMPAYRLSLQAREQHIRREKATSNICTAQVLLAVMASMYAVYHGPTGIRRIAEEVHAKAVVLADALRAAGIAIRYDSFFDTLTVDGIDSAKVVAAARNANVSLWQVSEETVQLAVDETTSVAELSAVAAAFGVAQVEPDALAAATVSQTAAASAAIPRSLARTTPYLTHQVFNSYHSETAMMRYLKRLSDKDYALDRGMIPLGSCTMKLNAASEMEAVTWAEFSGVHPFAPADEVAGSLELVRQIETWLLDVTGYDTVSIQPNAGSQGELAGLLAIRGYHLANGDTQRTVCLIPSSAHGTNAASAVLAGMSVVVIACDELGNIDLADLRAKIAEHADTLAALMITYPSTHGVYEHEIRTITDAVHETGGQVYVDGANLNALLGYARFGDFGGDVSHLNLHKTFCIPHGGGGPGVGPVAAKAHLAPYLPGHPMAQSTEHAVNPKLGMTSIEHGGGPVSAAPYGSSSILPISWAYVRMMGEQGLVAATGAAVLAANYVAARLRDHYPILYTGENGLVAHECILDLRPLKDATGITVDDVAKRLVDFGFHSPTMSFPVAGTLMVEPTESEDLAELDRFIEAMITIRAEADAVAAGTWPADDNPLVNAPHTAQSLIMPMDADGGAEWTHPYSREIAAYPVPGLVRNKYWPSVRRIDQAFGDRNLACTCPPIEAFADLS